MKENEKPKKRGRPPIKKNENSRLVADEYTDEPLSSLLSQLRETMRAYGTELDITTKERSGTIHTVEIRATIIIKP